MEIVLGCLHRSHSLHLCLQLPFAWETCCRVVRGLCWARPCIVNLALSPAVEPRYVAHFSAQFLRSPAACFFSCLSSGSKET